MNKPLMLILKWIGLWERLAVLLETLFKLFKWRFKTILKSVREIGIVS
jgi:hypothetical protein